MNCFAFSFVVAWAPPYPNFPKFGPHLHRYNSVRVHPYAHPQHMKVLKQFLYIQYGCGMQLVVVYSLNHDTTMSFGIHLAPSFQNVAPACTYNSVRVHPYAHPQHMKVLKHFLYVQYGCGMQSAVVVYSLSHDTTTSFGIHLTPSFQILPPLAHV